jgi:hypothetical protein
MQSNIHAIGKSVRFSVMAPVFRQNLPAGSQFLPGIERFHAVWNLRASWIATA